MTRALLAILLLLIAGMLLSNGRWEGVRPSLNAWQWQASPGDLSNAHKSLEKDCAACHTAVKGPDAAKCISCHATNTPLLQRQPSAFHANIGNCGQCHIEHQGQDANLKRMDHTVLAHVGLAQLNQGSEKDGQTGADLLTWVQQYPATAASMPGHTQISPVEMTLNCATCHATKEPHTGLFGPQCAHCHETQQWTIPAFQHPSSGSFDCAQCHQAPPSHYMEHFTMVSKPVAGQTDTEVAQCCGPAQVSQCFRCHQTTSWNDIKGVGWYKHH